MNTGTAPFWTMGATVVGNPAAHVITSSPGRRRLSAGSLAEVSADTASRFAEEPEFARTQRLTPIAAASSCSKASPWGPRVSQKSSAARHRRGDLVGAEHPPGVGHRGLARLELRVAFGLRRRVGPVGARRVGADEPVDLARQVLLRCSGFAHGLAARNSAICASVTPARPRGRRRILVPRDGPVHRLGKTPPSASTRGGVPPCARRAAAPPSPRDPGAFTLRQLPGHRFAIPEPPRGPAMVLRRRPEIEGTGQLGEAPARGVRRAPCEAPHPARGSPASGSSTCCHGRTAAGLRIVRRAGLGRRRGCSPEPGDRPPSPLPRSRCRSARSPGRPWENFPSGCFSGKKEPAPGADRELRGGLAASIRIPAPMGSSSECSRGRPRRPCPSSR